MEIACFDRDHRYTSMYVIFSGHIAEHIHLQLGAIMFAVKG